jgi:spoIIIJ-associated protein
VVESVEATGRTADEAIENALDELGLERDEVTIEVLAQAGQGRPARVRVTPLEGIELEDDDDDEYDDDEYDDDDDEEEEGDDEGLDAEEEGDEDEDEDDLEDEDEEDDDDDEEEDAPAVHVPARVPPPRRSPRAAVEISPEARPAADAAVAVLEDLLDRMDLQSDVRVDSAVIEEGLPTVELSIHGEYGGILIGRRGETLGALQFLAGLLTSKRAERRVRVVLDAEGYRERRARLLRDIAMRAADRAQRYRQPIFLDPMSPAERRIVHMTLADHQGVSTHSVGEGDSRRVVVSPRQAQRFGGYGSR